jgi:hypothetical protein
MTQWDCSIYGSWSWIFGGIFGIGMESTLILESLSNHPSTHSNRLIKIKYILKNAQIWLS